VAVRPNVSVNANCSDSHYEPTADHTARLSEGDFLLIDIWGRQDTATAVYYDITWTGVIGREPSPEEQRVFETVRNARDAASPLSSRPSLPTAPSADSKLTMRRARSFARRASASILPHRTGHNIAHEIHGPGAHLDNLETHDERRILPHTCFSVEPGIYLPKFGVRSEINMLTFG